MSQQDSVTTVPSWWERIEPWLEQETQPAAADTPASSLTDAEVIAAWTPVTQTPHGHWHSNPLLDLPLKSYAGMDKHKLWEMFVYRLAETEAQNILTAEQVWTESLEHHGLEAASLPDETEGLGSWLGNREAPLRPSHLAAGVIVWLWRNGLRYEAIGVFLQIWQTVRSQQESSPRQRIPWPAESALEGFHAVAYRDWNDTDQAEFAALFHERFVLKEIERGLEDLIS